MSLFAFIADYVPGLDAERDEHRPAHIDFLTALYDEGRLVLSGPSDPGTEQSGAIMVVRADSREEAESLMAGEPFVENRLATRTVREWAVRFGADRVEA